MSNPIPKEGALMEKELTVDLDTFSLVPSVVVPSVVVSSVVVGVFSGGAFSDGAFSGGGDN